MLARFIHVSFAAMAFCLLAGCGTMTAPNSLATPVGSYAVPSPAFSPRPALGVALLLFGGHDHGVFLGCLNCSKYDSGSVWNKYGDHGSRYSDTSIWNRYGTYGSKYSDESPWNPYAQNPPVVVDHDGNFYGYFTANRYFQKRTTIPSLLKLLDNYDTITENLDDVIDSMR